MNERRANAYVQFIDIIEQVGLLPGETVEPNGEPYFDKVDDLIVPVVIRSEDEGVTR